MPHTPLLRVGEETFNPGFACRCFCLCFGSSESIHASVLSPITLCTFTCHPELASRESALINGPRQLRATDAARDLLFCAAGNHCSGKPQCHSEPGPVRRTAGGTPLRAARGGFRFYGCRTRGWRAVPGVGKGAVLCSVFVDEGPASNCIPCHSRPATSLTLFPSNNSHRIPAP